MGRVVLCCSWYVLGDLVFVSIGMGFWGYMWLDWWGLESRREWQMGFERIGEVSWVRSWVGIVELEFNTHVTQIQTNGSGLCYRCVLFTLFCNENGLYFPRR